MKNDYISVSSGHTSADVKYHNNKHTFCSFQFILMTHLFSCVEQKIG